MFFPLGFWCQVLLSEQQRTTANADMQQSGGETLVHLAKTPNIFPKTTGKSPLVLTWLEVKKSAVLTSLENASHHESQKALTHGKEMVRAMAPLTHLHMPYGFTQLVRGKKHFILQLSTATSRGSDCAPGQRCH